MHKNVPIYDGAVPGRYINFTTSHHAYQTLPQIRPLPDHRHQLVRLVMFPDGRSLWHRIRHWLPRLPLLWIERGRKNRQRRMAGVGMAHHVEAHAGLIAVRCGAGVHVRHLRAEREHDGGRGEGSDQLNVNPIECRER